MKEVDLKLQSINLLLGNCQLPTHKIAVSWLQLGAYKMEVQNITALSILIDFLKNYFISAVFMKEKGRKV